MPDSARDAHGQVDLSEQEQPDLRHAQQHVDRRLHHQVGEVLRGQEVRTARFEVDDQDDEANQDRYQAAVALPEFAELEF
jgi:hypothetical protein